MRPCLRYLYETLKTISFGAVLGASPKFTHAMGKGSVSNISTPATLLYPNTRWQPAPERAVMGKGPSERQPGAHSSGAVFVTENPAPPRSTTARASAGYGSFSKTYAGMRTLANLGTGYDFVANPCEVTSPKSHKRPGKSLRTMK